MFFNIYFLITDNIPFKSKKSLSFFLPTGSSYEERGAGGDPRDGRGDVGVHDRGERGVAANRRNLEPPRTNHGFVPLVGAGIAVGNTKVWLSVCFSLQLNYWFYFDKQYIVKTVLN